MKITQKVDKSDKMKFVNKGEVLSNDSYVVESNSEEHKRIQAALHLYADLENGKLAEKLTAKIASSIGGDDL